MAGKLSSRRVDRARARLLSAAHGHPVHGGMCRAAERLSVMRCKLRWSRWRGRRSCAAAPGPQPRPPLDSDGVWRCGAAPRRRSSAHMMGTPWAIFAVVILAAAQLRLVQRRAGGGLHRLDVVAGGRPAQCERR